MKKTLLLICLFTLTFVTRSSALMLVVGVGPAGMPIYAPGNFTLSLGDTVMWQIAAPGNYSTESTIIPIGAATWNAPINMTMPQYMYIPTEVGVYHYQCSTSPGMIGEFTILDTGSCTVPSNAVITGGSSVCSGNNDTLVVTANGGTDYQWLVGGSIITGATDTMLVISVAGTYSCIVSDTCGADTTADFIVSTGTTPTPNIGHTHTNSSYSFTGTGTGITAWNWNFGDLGTASIQNPQHTYTALGNYTVTLTATGSGGCEGVDTVHVHITTLDVRSVNDDELISLSPNPAHGYMVLDAGKENATLKLYDITGREFAYSGIKSQSGGKTAYDISNLPKGLYMVRMTINEMVITKKLVVE